MEILNQGKILKNFGEVAYAYKCKGCDHSVKLKLSEFRPTDCFHTEAPEAICGKCNNCDRSIYYWLEGSDEYDFITVKPPTFKEIAKPLLILVSIIAAIIGVVSLFFMK